MLGIGAMLGQLSGNSETVDAYKPTVGKTIKTLTLQDDEVLRVSFDDGTAIRVWDDGQSCCESRYMRTDDNLADYSGAKLLGMELRDAPSIHAEYDDHDVQFLVVKTDKGNITFSSHVEHNGYYGGFSIQIRNEKSAGGLANGR